MQKSIPNAASAVLATENIQRNESEPLLDLKNTRSAKHVEICVPTPEGEEGEAKGKPPGPASGDGMAYRQQRGSGGPRKERGPKDRHGKDRGGEGRPRPTSQHSEAGSTEYSYSETGR